MAGKRSFSRRTFLKRSAIVLGGTVVTLYLSRGSIRRFAARKIEALDVPSLLSTYRPDFWFEVLPDNTVRMRSPKVDMGQGIFAGFALLAAEELDLPPDRIRVEHADTVSGPVDKVNTGGSNSTSSLFVSIREVAATMREMLKGAAARKWGVTAVEISTQDGMLSAGSQQATYAEIAASTADWVVPDTPALRPISAFRWVGKEVVPADLQEKVVGASIFAIDQHLPGMCYALTLQSPYIDSVLRSADTRAAAQVEGVLQVLEEKDLVAVVAESRHAAETALALIEADWEVPRAWQQADIEEMVSVGSGTRVTVQREGKARSLLASDPGRVLRQEYRTPMAGHAQMEPTGAIAHYTEEGVTILMGTQAPGLVRDAVAKALGVKKARVRLQPLHLGGGFGRRVHLHNAVQAACISQAVGRPVHVFNTREQEFQHSLYRPNTHHVLQAKIGTDGRIEAITHDLATPDMTLEAAAGKIALTIAGADFISAGHGASILYPLQHRSTTIWNSTTPVRTGIWRSVGLFANAFAIESFVNELAHETGRDPISLRRDLLDGADDLYGRCRHVLDTLAEKSGWQMLPPPPGTGRGMALSEDRRSIAAAVAEVHIDNGAIRVTRITHVLDAGLAINPEGIRMQVEGCIMMGISAALYEEITVADGRVAASNYHQYRLASLADTPEIEVVILQGADRPYGVGEPPIGPIAPAIAAAVFEATGKRLRSLPLRL